MTDLTVKIEPGSGVALIEIRDAAISEPRFRLRDTATEKFLAKRGWTKTASFLPTDAVISQDITTLTLDADLARRILSGTSLSLEQPASNFFATLVWPVATSVAAVDPQPESSDEPKAVDEAPTSLEPHIRDEATTHLTAPVIPSVVAEDTAAENKYEDEEQSTRSWGLVAAAAVVFLLLGSLLTYFWQSSAYENDLRTAMSALEAQRDQEKAEFDKRLAEANANKTSTGTITAANTQIASLTDQTAQLTKDRDAARKAVADQQAAARDLEAKLATATGEIETLKQATETDATAQSTEFQGRIADLTKELDQTKQALAETKEDLAVRDKSLGEVQTALTAADEQVEAMKQAAEKQATAQNDVLNGKIKSLSEELDKSAQALSARDQTLRDVQAKLSVANVQIEALKTVAGKATEANLARTTLSDQISKLTANLDSTGKELAAKEQELIKVKTSLDAANALLASNAVARDASADDQVAGLAENPASREAPAGLQQERDIYARELSTMTENFTALKTERDKLQQTIKTLEQQLASAGSNNTPKTDTRAVWGATAIDAAGAIYSLQNQIAEKSATDNVVAICRGKSKSNCEPLRTYQSSCISVARIEGEGPRNDNFGFSVNKDWKAAEAGALRECQQLGAGCSVRFTSCSPDGISKPVVVQ